MKLSLTAIRAVAQFASAFNISSVTEQRLVDEINNINEEDIIIAKMISEELESQKELTFYLNLSDQRWRKLNRDDIKRYQWKLWLFLDSLERKIIEKFPSKFPNIKDILNEENIRKVYKLNRKAFNETKNKIKNGLKQAKQSDKKYFKQFKTEAGNVNIVENEINSKFIEYELKKVLELWNVLKNEISPLQKEINDALNLEKRLYWAAVGMGTIAAGLWIGSLFFQPLAVPALIVSGITAILDNLSNSIGKTINDNVKKLNKIYETIRNLGGKDVKDLNLSELSNIFSNLGFFEGVAIGKTIETIGSALKNPAIEALATKLSVATEVLSIMNNLNKAIQALERCNQMYKEIISTEGRIKSIGKKYQDLNKVDWVVLDETKQNGHYNEGGTGGKNLIFKNRITNKIYTLNELLSKSNIELKWMRLMKVYNPRINEYYIRTLRNKIKEDNLG
ncbi:Uncharacterised protein [Metamycoplasma arthritidis]|uniref:Hypothetical membrane protein n=1 Tax=Metamycoplasma arthritidis (strain 158L3-1) TaxID=243272 RepID=B3PMW6_META1|nr:hypothetical protein [Metamycoplasma arthritidis]ACF07368.1 hypothetical membrane protein [Metamycoplasma arthritidis 158L3-1]VEU78888.1 Uncharacterised protein [Metamycoplasma arthritidis]